jgi:hypothetical protein
MSVDAFDDDIIEFIITEFDIIEFDVIEFDVTDFIITRDFIGLRRGRREGDVQDNRAEALFQRPAFTELPSSFHFPRLIPRRAEDSWPRAVASPQDQDCKRSKKVVRNRGR